MNWDKPEARYHLIEKVGLVEYARLHRIYRRSAIVSTVNGVAIRPINTRHGILYSVANTGRAFSTLPEAERFAEKVSGKDDLGRDTSWYGG